MEPEAARRLIDNELTRALPGSTRWADLGAGGGTFTRALASLLKPGSEIYAVDLSPMPDIRVADNTVRVIPVKADFEREVLAFRDLDGLLMANSLHYVKDKSALLTRLRTLLKPQGQVIVVEYDTDRPVTSWVPYPLTFASLRRLFMESGFSAVRLLGEMPSKYRQGNLYAGLITG